MGQFAGLDGIRISMHMEGAKFIWPCILFFQHHAGEGAVQRSPQAHSPVSHCFPARYLGWMPVSEDRLVTGQCVKAVHSCISKMAASLQDKEKQVSFKRIHRGILYISSVYVTQCILKSSLLGLESVGMTHITC